MKITIQNNTKNSPKKPLIHMRKKGTKYVSEYRSEQKILEFEFAHFSPDAIIRKTMEVIA